MPDVQQRDVSPTKAFYRRYSAAQIDAILDALTRRAEFPFELTYLGDGSELWRTLETRPGPDNSPVQRDFDTLLELHAERLAALAPSPVQVVDLGPGTTRPIHGLLRHLLDRSRLAGYRGMDISAEMLEMAERNLRAGFPGHAEDFELSLGDFAGPDLARVLPADDGNGPVRLVVLAGGTLFNLADPGRFLRRVGQAMSGRDVLLLTLRIDTGANRPPYMDRVRVGGPTKPQHLVGLDLLGVDRSWYVNEAGFDRDRSEIYTRVRFVEAVAVTLDVDGGRRVVSFEPGDTVLVWRYRYLDEEAIGEQLERSGLRVRLCERGTSGQVLLFAATRAG